MKLGKFLNFNLEKLYLDCIDESGNCFIIYRAYLKFYFFKVAYSALLFSDFQNKITEKTKLKKIGQPLINGPFLYYENPHLQIKGSWQRLDDPIFITLFKGQKGEKLTWSCHHSKALTKIEYGGKVFKGLGYAETLYLPVKPWKLPVKIIKWGRFLSDYHTVIWIRWEGEYPVNKLFFNGTLYEDAVFDQDKISFGEAKYILSFQEISVLRESSLASTLSDVFFLEMFLKSRIFSIYEKKYKAKAVLNYGHDKPSIGWALYETVTC